MIFVVFYLTALLIGRNYDSVPASIILNILGGYICLFLVSKETV